LTLLLALVLLLFPVGPAPSVKPPAKLAASSGAWTVYHHDDAHTGYDSSLPALSSVSTGWVSPVMDAEVYASPLIYNGVVYAATLNNTVYAFNQSTGATLWSKHLGTPQTSGWGCGNIRTMGIVGTPVIDVAANRIYAVAEITGTTPTYHLFGLDLANLGNVVLDTPIAPAGFDWTIQQERGALAIANGFVYVPFGGRWGDCGVYHGYLVGVPTNGTTTLAVYQTPGSGNGYWSAGGVVVDDATGNVFETSGNGNTGNGCNTVAGGAPQYENDAVVRLSPTLAHLDSFMPNDWQPNWCSNDQDLGSASAVLLSPNLLFQAGKWGGGFLLNPNSLGGVDGQLFPTPKPATYAQTEVCFGNHGDATFGSFAYGAPYVYVGCEGRGLVALNVNTSTNSFSACTTCASPDWNAGGSATFGPPIVAGGAVWVADNTGLYAFNTATGAQVYHSASFGINRFVTPAEAGGQVFVPSHTVIRSFQMNFCPSAAALAGKPLVGDYDGDGKGDLALVGGNGTCVALSTGTAFSNPALWANTPFYGSMATLAGDVTGDGKADLVAVNGGQTFVMPSTGTAFGPPQSWATVPFYGSRGTFLADVNGDGKADLIAVNDTNVWVMLSTGSGFSGPTLWSTGPFFGNVTTLAGDLTGNGKADLVAVNTTNAWVMTSTGSAFAAPVLWSNVPFYGKVATLVGDVSGDHKADLVAVNSTGSWVMTSTGSNFAPPAMWSSVPFYGALVTLVGDVNGDGKLDLIAVNSGGVWVTPSTGSGFSSPALWLAAPP
jgi:FG-GAP-like repeat/PQQ-like domain